MTSSPCPLLNNHSSRSLSRAYSFTCLGDTIFHHHGQEHRSGPARHRGHHLPERRRIILLPPTFLRIHNQYIRKQASCTIAVHCMSRRHLQRGNTASNEAVAFICYDIDRSHFTTWTKVLWAWYIITH